MVRGLIALFFAVASATPGSISNLCTALLAAPCSGGQFPAGVDQTGCVALFTAATWISAGDTDNTTGNSIGCREHYATAANATNGYCRYGGVGGGGMCGGEVDNACNLVQQVCTGANSQYTNVAACSAATTGLGDLAGVWGSKTGTAAQSENSVECRIYHTLAAYNNNVPTAGVTDLHCNHTHPVSAGGQPCSGVVSTDALHYCQTADAFCTGTVKQYNNVDECMTSFVSFPDNGTVSADTTTWVNTRGCRQYHVQAAAAGAGQVHCSHGGPSGAGVCGTTTQAWVSITNNSYCKSLANSSWVGTSVLGAVSSWMPADLNIVVPDNAAPTSYTVGAGGDDRQCRIYHSTVASNMHPDHCEHGSITSSTCSPTGGALCRLWNTACSTFTSEATCLTALAATPLITTQRGTPLDNNGAPNTDTLACRTYQAALALASKAMGQTAGVTASCANVKIAQGPGCGGGSTAKSDATTLFVSAAAIVPLMFL